ncbi:putative reverse transcriptase domain-containing protein [Tanacetum coccineum]
MCRKCNQEGHIAKYYMDKVANDISRQTCFECESLNHLRTNCLRNNGNQPHGRDFVITANEAQQDPNVMTGTFSLNNHFATVLFDFGADYSFISTKLLPLINAKPSAINPEYEIEIDNGLKIETNKIVHGCRLELEGFKAEIICHEKISPRSVSRKGFWKFFRRGILDRKMKQLKTMKTDKPVPRRISFYKYGSSNVQPSESPYLPVPFIGMSQTRQHDKSESVSYYLTD